VGLGAGLDAGKKRAGKGPGLVTRSPAELRRKRKILVGKSKEKKLPDEKKISRMEKSLPLLPRRSEYRLAAHLGKGIIRERKGCLPVKRKKTKNGRKERGETPGQKRGFFSGGGKQASLVLHRGGGFSKRTSPREDFLTAIGKKKGPTSMEHQQERRGKGAPLWGKGKDQQKGEEGLWKKKGFILVWGELLWHRGQGGNLYLFLRDLALQLRSSPSPRKDNPAGRDGGGTIPYSKKKILLPKKGREFPEPQGGGESRGETKKGSFLSMPWEKGCTWENRMPCQNTKGVKNPPSCFEKASDPADMARIGEMGDLGETATGGHESRRVGKVGARSQLGGGGAAVVSYQKGRLTTQPKKSPVTGKARTHPRKKNGACHRGKRKTEKGGFFWRKSGKKKKQPG